MHRPILLKYWYDVRRIMGPRSRPRDKSRKRLAERTASGSNAALIATFLVIIMTFLQLALANVA